MAEAVIEVVLGNLNSLVQKELGLFLGFDQDLERLASVFTTIKATLADAEEQQFSSRSIKDWLQKLKEAAYILDDILDECAYEALRLEYQGVKLCPSNKVKCSGLSTFHPKRTVFRYKIAKKMKRICERLEEIADERTKFHLAEMVPERRSGVIEWRQTSSFISEPHVYGREEDRDKLIDFLVHDASHDENLSVYPIIGLGGLGKTTLSQLIFNHERVRKHFEPRVWICVSEDFGLRRMTKAIIEAVSGHACEDLDLDPLQRKLQDLLQNKRYLLVLDDVWDDDPESWERLKSVLVCGALGASVLVTTRLTKVAAIMGTVPPHELSNLSDNDCWRLFKHRAFVADEVELEELVVVGKEIVKKCGGVPLAAKVLGGLLRFKREVREWLKVKESNIWGLTHNIMPALRLSYLNLPIHLKQCFAYCAIFPKDERIEKQYLVELWMTNGFISSDGKLDAEDVGDGIWNELYWRSFFQDIEKDEFGEVESFKMHDLVYDLAQFVAEEVCCITNDDDIHALFERKRIHHLSDYGWEFHPAQLHQVKSLRTYLGKNVQLSPDVVKCYSLRLLQFKPRKELLSAIGDLKHLRYLNLSHGNFQTLPESLCRLLNLQILKLDYCYTFKKLPDSLVRLKALQQLSLKDCKLLSRLAPYIGKLTSLRNLSMYLVGEGRGFLLAELGPLKLKGCIDIKHLERVKSMNDAKESNMSSKQLNKLTLRWKGFREGELARNDEEVLEALKPCNQTLQSLRLEGYQGLNFPQWMSSPCFKSLTYLKLWFCRNCIKLPVLRKLPSLKRLVIGGAKYVKYVQEESNDDDDHVAFMALEYLSLESLPSLIRLSSEDGENQFPCLFTLKVNDCPNFSLHGLHSLKTLEIMRLPKLKVWPGLQCLTSLEVLGITGCDEVEGLQYMTALKKLSLRNLPNMESLPDCFGELSLLRELSIVGCYKLMRLSTSLSLSSVEVLSILDCNLELSKRCEKENGEDWPIIAHIPHLYV
ncbi:disease resistance protein RGA2-like isoform X1 [Vigna radiata var. radiata]|uniref:Disease resistance protein RGA2-like isoform X1 n=1 Tax=Vigna radiata var. radiata TaxID=3916 RepID=A0A1S3V2G7_VIGRR|nr:disease resistance protein RGA2-like isoform X1 [Vigna radiata var. radiata]